MSGVRGGSGSGDVDLISMVLSASCGDEADLKLGLRCGDLELHLFSPSGSDLGWSIRIQIQFVVDLDLDFYQYQKIWMG